MKSRFLPALPAETLAEEGAMAAFSFNEVSYTE